MIMNNGNNKFTYTLPLSFVDHLPLFPPPLTLRLAVFWFLLAPPWFLLLFLFFLLFSLISLRRLSALSPVFAFLRSLTCSTVIPEIFFSLLVLFLLLFLITPVVFNFLFLRLQAVVPLIMWDL